MTYFPIDEFEARWSRTYDEMNERGYTHAVVFGFSAGNYNRSGDVQYLTNYYSNTSVGELDNGVVRARGYAAVILENGRLPELFIDEGTVRPGLLATDDRAMLGNRCSSQLDPIASLADGLRRRRIQGRVALVGEHMLPIKYHRQLTTLTPQITWEGQDDLVTVVREVKSFRELNVYREGARYVSSASDALCKSLIRRQREVDAAVEAGRIWMEGGGRVIRTLLNSDGSFYPPTDPFNGYCDRIPQPGDLILAPIYGTVRENYWMDPVRTVFGTGQATAPQRDLLRTCANIVDKVMARIKNGTNVRELAAYADRLRQEALGVVSAVDASFPYSGHGLGLFWERPWLGVKTATEDEFYRTNQVASVEIFLERPQVGFVALEQNFIVHNNGTELLTTNPLIYE